ncbi:MAG TPA: polysaccharide biosynthesis tyrosine autokinase [Verrucomicrobiae bacterium]|nr:polysaccharide biosynthesis tyrosine autokinase [Verrucomicrobiae bacterium]
MNHNGNLTNKGAVDLFAPTSRFVSASKIYGRAHRGWLVLRKHWEMLVLLWVAVTFAAWAYSLLSGPRYQSKARMVLTGKINVSGDELYTEELINFLGTQAELLRSPAIQRRAMASLLAESLPASDSTVDRGARPDIQAKAKTVWKANFASGSAVDINAPPAIPFSIKVEEGSKSSTLDLRAIGPKPASTRRFLDCLMEAYLSYKRESLDTASTQASASLNAETMQLKSQLELAQAKLHDFQATNNVVFLQQQGAGAETHLASLSRELGNLRTDLKLLDSLTPEQWVESESSQGSVVSGQNSGEEAQARQTLANLQESQAALFQADQKMHLLMAERDDLSRVLRPAHPKIIKLSQEIAAQEELVQVARDEASKQLNLRHQALQLKIRNLESASKEWDAQAIAASQIMSNYEQIRLTVQRLQTAYDKTLDLMQNIDVRKRVEQENLGILDPASVAVSTHRLLTNMALATAISLLLGVGALFLVALIQDNFASRLELTEELSEPVVGQVPSISMEVSRPPLGRESLEMEHYEFLEAFRNIRATLLCQHNRGAKPMTVMLASSIPEEGKSTLAVYLAGSLARAKSRVLLVDGDMRRPSLHKHFHLPSGPGLAELLDEEISAAEVILPTSIENLALLPAGAAKRYPGELVLSPKWEQFLASVKPRFDYILVDTPPVMATEDAAALAPKVDGVLFVVRALFASARVVHGALDVLRQRRANLVGLIFNRAESSPCESPYYQPYAHAYHWQPEKPRLKAAMPASESAFNGGAASSNESI